MNWLERQMRFLLCALAVASAGCATSEPETVPLELIGSYDERPDESTKSAASATRDQDKTISPECRQLRQSIENWRTAYHASIGLGALGFATGAIGLLTGSEEVQKIGGVLGSLGTLSQATTATGQEIQNKKAAERDCWIE